MNATALELPAPRAWLFDRRTDLLVFTGPALAAFALVAVGFHLGIADGDTPPGLWLIAVLGVDVAHVWSTIYRTYTDGSELRRRPVLYFVTPIVVYLAGVAVHLAGGALWFWRVLAYIAVFHFIRQQYGWLALYRRRANEVDGKWIDTFAIYSATVCPLVWWHATPGRHFHWFLEGDFVLALPHVVGSAALAIEAVALLAYFARAVTRPALIGKHLLVLTTALCWFAGIVAFDSDFIFTVTNVLIHGVPYFALIWRYAQRRYSDPRSLMHALFHIGWPAMYLTLVGIAFVEEGMWDRFVWHDHVQFFGDGADLSALALAFVVPLLAVPQGVHYVLDAFVWKVGPKNPELAERLGFSSRAEPTS